jgi:RNA polymerase sigma-70 factor (ECF subfamily)
MDPERFCSLLRRVRAGDAQAANELVDTYGPALRRHVRMQLTDPHLRRYLDTLDVFQSVLCNFFFRIAAGEFDLRAPQQLTGLLATMARRRILNYARDERTRRRDARRVVPNGDEALADVADTAPTPPEAAANAEILQRALEELSAEERALIEERGEGLSWEEIAERHNDSAEALRKRLNRAIERVTRSLGLEDG